MSSTAAVSTGDHKHPGRGSGEVEEEICLLDPSTSSRGQGNCQGPLGRPNCDSGVREMGAKSTAGTALADGGHQQVSVTSSIPSEHLFFVDASTNAKSCYEPYIYGMYQRQTDVILGEESVGGTEEGSSQSLCYNCGSPDHVVSTCPFRRDSDLISLSRQYYNFYKDLRGIADHPRIHLAEGWRQQRLEWLELFQPGQIRGSLLRDAIGPGDGDWLRNIATWGYPPGWISASDPQKRVFARIWNEHLDSGYSNSDEPFYIFGNANDEVEDVSHNNVIKGETPCSYDEKEIDNSESETVSTSRSTSPTPRRWAKYPSSYFSSELLFPYTPQEAPPSSSIEWNSVFDGDDYYAQLYGLPPPPPNEPPPPLPPLPPSSCPPPLPPSSPPSLPSSSSRPPPPSCPPPLSPPFPPPLPPDSTPILPPSFTRLQTQAKAASVVDDDDMDISDSE